MQIGDILTHDGRRYLIRGFDPEGVSPRVIYLEDAATGAHTTLPFEDLSSPSKYKDGLLRLVTRSSAKKAPREG